MIGYLIDYRCEMLLSLGNSETHRQWLLFLEVEGCALGGIFCLFGDQLAQGQSLLCRLLDYQLL
jgi:hypothetical protein